MEPPSGRPAAMAIDEYPGGLGGEDQELEEAALLAPDHHPPGGELLAGRLVHGGEVRFGRRRVRFRVRQHLGLYQWVHG